MVQISVNVHNDLDSALNKISEANLEKGLYYMIDAQALPDMNNYVPLDGGELRMSGHREGDTAVWDTPYAKVQYDGTAGRSKGFVSDKQRRWFFANMVDDNGNYLYEPGYTTAGTGPKWDEVAYAAHGEAWLQAFIVGADLL